MSEITPWLLASLLLLLLRLVVGLARALRGPTLEDRMLSVQLLGTGGVGTLLLTPCCWTCRPCWTCPWCWPCWR